MEHIHSILNDVKGINEDKNRVMEKFISSWQTYVIERSKGRLSSEDIKFQKQLIDGARTSAEEVVKWANKVKNGKWL